LHLSRALETIPDQVDRADAEHRGGRDGAAARAEPAKSPASEQPDTRSEKGGKPPTPPKAKQAQPQPSLLATARQHPFIVIAGALVVLLALAAALVWWLNARNYESTDDAFIDARTVSISSQVNGAIVEVPVDDNQDVAAGAVLARIDERDYRAAVDQAKRKSRSAARRPR
jgi:membrane fusion protein, multidrug efflux system